MEKFCQTASMLLKAGLRLPQIMDIIIQANRNRIIRQALEQVRDRLVQGEGLSQPMAEITLFPPLLVEMAAVGEKTGAMDTTLATLADFYEKKVDRKIDTLISMIEPILTVTGRAGGYFYRAFRDNASVLDTKVNALNVQQAEI